ncbi:MAG: dethiobiotin synthase [Deltaproteobacteria bacterium]|nr:dethiobiotin synthase [Deltaproteobacteria bacterium]
MGKTIFVCGTDTGVGKTVVTGALLAWLNAKGIRAGGFKPTESGCGGMRRHLKRADAEFLKKRAAMPEPLDAINPYYFREALAPGVAAKRLGRIISFSKIARKLKALEKNYDLILAEGAGGLLVPLQGKKTTLDLIRFLKVPVLLVGRLGLGTINHTLLTVEVLKRNRIPLLGVILNETTPRMSLAEKTNPSVLKAYGVPVWGVFPHLKGKSRLFEFDNFDGDVLERFFLKGVHE